MVALTICSDFGAQGEGISHYFHLSPFYLPYSNGASGPITSWEIDGETVETVSGFTFLGSQITADGDCSHKIKRRLLLGRKVMTHLDSIFKRETLLCQLRSVYSRLWFFQWSCMNVRVGLWRKLSTKELMLPWTARRSNQSILKEISFLHSPTLTSIHDHRKNHSLD